MNEWNAIESSWCITALRKRILWAQIAFNCPEFHFLIKASDSLAGSWLGAYEVCPVHQKRNGMAAAPEHVPGLCPRQAQPRRGPNIVQWGRQGERSPSKPAMSEASKYKHPGEVPSTAACECLHAHAHTGVLPGPAPLLSLQPSGGACLC